MIFFICTAVFIVVLYSFFRTDLRNKNELTDLSKEDKLLQETSNKYVLFTVIILVSILLLSPNVAYVPVDEVLFADWFGKDYADYYAGTNSSLQIATLGFVGVVQGLVSWWWFFVLFPLFRLSKKVKNISFAVRASFFLSVCLLQAAYVFKLGEPSPFFRSVVNPFSEIQYAVHHWLSGMYIYSLLLLYVLAAVWVYFSNDGGVELKNKKMLWVSVSSVIIALFFTLTLNPMFSDSAIDQKKISSEQKAKRQAYIEQKHKETEERIIRGYNESPEEKMRRAIETIGSSTAR